MRSNSKAVRDLVRSHILSFHSVDELRELVEGFGSTKASTYHTVYNELMNGPEFLFQNSDIAEFLKSLDLNGAEKEYDTMKSWNLYRHLIASEVHKMIG